MEIKKIVEDLTLLPNTKTNIKLQSQDEITQWQVEQIVKNLEIPNDYACYLRQYDYTDINENENIVFFIGGLGHMSEQFATPEPTDTEAAESLEKFYFPSIHVAGTRLYEDNILTINVAFSLNLIEPTGIFFELYITDFLSGLGRNDGKSNIVGFSSEELYYVPNFTAFVLKIPELITQKGIQELIIKANIDFDIDKVGNYGHLRQIPPSQIDDGLPF